MNDLNSNKFYQYGKYLIKHNSNSNYVGLRRFKSFFGVSPAICVLAWDNIKNELPDDYKEIHLLWSLFFLKCYNTENVSRSICLCDEKTFRKRVWTVIDRLAFMKVIEWEDRKVGSSSGQSSFVSLDGVDLPINEPHPFSSKWYSHKLKGSGLRYEIGLCIKTGEIVWTNGGYACGDLPDLKIAREVFVDFLEPGEKAVADQGYRDNRYFILPTDENSIRHNQIMSRHETINKRIQQFNILCHKFRNDRFLHRKCFNAIVNLTQLVLQYEQPLFSI